MSLWYKNPSEITFADVDDFCKTMQPEGPRLDYKGVGFPKDLEKTIAAFANTLGGLIILGVDADKTTNTPIWPPTAGMPMEPGLSERVVQKAQDAIHPPVRVGVSKVIQNEHLNGDHAIIVIRVNESREAPHAIAKNRRVYVYERTDNKNEPYELADMVRIEHLLNRRKRLIDQREEELTENIARAERQMFESICPIRWISVAPAYPWRDIHDPYDCVAFHQHLALMPFHGVHWTYQTFVGGSFAVGKISYPQTTPICTCISSVSANGTLFCMTHGEEAMNDNQTLLTANENVNAGKLWMDIQRIRGMASSFFTGCHKFYEQSKMRPGEVLVSIGIRNAHGLYMHDSANGRKSNAPFPDPHFRIDRFFDSEGMLTNRRTAITEMFDEIAFSFNAHAVLR